MKHCIVIETGENEFVPESNPTTDDLIRYLKDAIAVRQGDAEAKAHFHWWMRDVSIICADDEDIPQPLRMEKVPSV